MVLRHLSGARYLEQAQLDSAWAKSVRPPKLDKLLSGLPQVHQRAPWGARPWEMARLRLDRPFRLTGRIVRDLSRRLYRRATEENHAYTYVYDERGPNEFLRRVCWERELFDSRFVFRSIGRRVTKEDLNLYALDAFTMRQSYDPRAQIEPARLSAPSC